MGRRLNMVLRLCGMFGFGYSITGAFVVAVDGERLLSAAHVGVAVVFFVSVLMLKGGEARRRERL